jgi:uncharacterized protein
MDSMQTPRLQFRNLPATHARDILSRNHLGRLAFTFRDRVDIRPISYKFKKDWIFGRTAPGEKILTIRHHRWVAFQVDEVEDDRNWVSVIVHGPLYLLDEAEGQDQTELQERARVAVQEMDPLAFTEKDPVPERSILFGVAVEHLSGREARIGSSLP